MAVSEKTDDALAVLASKTNIVKAMADLLDAQLQLLKPTFSIWVEENGQMGTNAYEWSYGNGATGSDIGCPFPFACELFAITFNCDSFVSGASAGINIRRKAVAATGSGSIVGSGMFTTQNGRHDFATPIQFAADEMVIVQTGAVVPTITDARVFMWFRKT